jgi:Tfp pilus assembly protein PilF
VIKADDPTSLVTKSLAVSPEVYIASAQLHQHSRNFDKAAEFYDKVLDQDPGNLDALIGYARMLDRQNEYAEAVTYYERATQHHPANASAFNDLGLCFARQGNLQGSIQSLQRAIQLKPDSKLYRNNIATVLVENNQAEAALQYLSEVHTEAVANYNVGYLLHQRGQSVAARQYFAQAASADPQFHEARAMLANLADGTSGTAEQVASRPNETSSGVQPTNGPTPPSGAGVTEQAPILHGPLDTAGPHADRHLPPRDAGVRMPTKTAPVSPSRHGTPPLPNGESFMYSNSVIIEHLPPVR